MISQIPIQSTYPAPHPRAPAATCFMYAMATSDALKCLYPRSQLGCESAARAVAWGVDEKRHWHLTEMRPSSADQNLLLSLPNSPSPSCWFFNPSHLVRLLNGFARATNGLGLSSSLCSRKARPASCQANFSPSPQTVICISDS